MTAITLGKAMYQALSTFTKINDADQKPKFLPDTKWSPQTLGCLDGTHFSFHSSYPLFPVFYQLEIGKIAVKD